MAKKVFTLLLFVIFGGLFNVIPVEAVTYERLFYFRDGEYARKSFFANYEFIDIFAPQSYSINTEGVLIGKIESDLLSFAQKNKIKIMPLLTNGSFHATTSKIFLDDPVMQDVLIDNLVKEANDFGYIGWQIDFEQMDLSYRDKFTEFIMKAYKVFQKNNLKLSVAVIAQISENPNDYPKNLWQRIIGVYDYKKIGENTDFVSLMSYDDPNSLGPVAGRLWYEKVIIHSLSLIPKEKISLGIPFYYWRWDDAQMKRVGIGGGQNLTNLIKKHQIKFDYSEDEQAPFFHFWENGKSYTGWYENARSVGYKISLIKKYGLRGFSAWALGLELQSVFSVMK